MTVNTWRAPLTVAAAATLALGLAATSTARRPDGEPPPPSAAATRGVDVPIPPDFEITVPPVDTRVPAGLARGAFRPIPERRPLLPISQYRALKARGLGASSSTTNEFSSYHGLRAPGATERRTPGWRTGRLKRQSPKSYLAAARQTNNFAGIDSPRSGHFHPPDTHGAAGTQYFAEVTNSNLDVWNKATGGHERSISLASFFFYFQTPIIDPRVIRDNDVERWIVTAMALPESSTTQKFFIAVSDSPSILGAYTFWHINVNQTGDDFFDFPQLGQTERAIVITAIIFDLGADLTPEGEQPRYSQTFALSKADLFEGNVLRSDVWNNLPLGITPPNVLDGNHNVYLIAPGTSGGASGAYPLYELSIMEPIPGWKLPAILTSRGEVTAGAWQVPAEAPDCLARPINTFDGRFVNASTQTGTSLWQVHTVALDPVNQNFRATPRFVQVNTAQVQLVQAGILRRSATSSDFNASIAANSTAGAVVTWNSTDNTQSGCVPPEIRFAGREATDAPGSMPSRGVVYASAIGYDPVPPLELNPEDSEPWGDYSAVSLDPLPGVGCTSGSEMWVVNEHVNGNTRNEWGSRIAEISFC